MPRVHINLHDIDEIADLEEQEDWEEQLGLAITETRRDLSGGADSPYRARGERRFGGSEKLDRKRADRRKSVVRSVRRIQP
jgi:hypothetical protein